MNATTDYINHIFPQKDYANYKRIPFEKALIWVHTHPTSVKILKTVSYIFGSLLIVASLPIFATSLITASAVFSSGAAIISIFAFKTLDIAAPPKHNMKKHVFKCFDSKYASLSYKNDVPIFKLKTSDPFKAGFAQGYHLGKHINLVKRRWSLAIQFLPDFMPFLHTTPKNTKLKNLIEQTKKKIPKEYLKEMEGLVEGYNKWASEKFLFKPRKITLEEVVLFHLEPDIRHIKHLDLEKNISGPIQNQSVACASIADMDKDEGMIFGRNTDWPSFGLMGTHSLVVTRKSLITGKKTVDVTIPGFLGTLAGMNENGLCVSINICNGNTTKVNGMPNSLFTRYVLEKSKRAKDVRKHISNSPSMGPFHLFATDEREAIAYLVKQGDKPYMTRKFDGKKTLFITNFSYDKNGVPNYITNDDKEDDVNFSSIREKRLKSLFEDVKQTINPKNLNMAPVIEKALKLPFVNNIITTHSAIFKPKQRSMKVCFDNAYSANNKLRELKKEDLF